MKAKLFAVFCVFALSTGCGADYSGDIVTEQTGEVSSSEQQGTDTMPKVAREVGKTGLKADDGHLHHALIERRLRDQKVNVTTKTCNDDTACTTQIPQDLHGNPEPWQNQENSDED